MEGLRQRKATIPFTGGRIQVANHGPDATMIVLLISAASTVLGLLLMLIYWRLDLHIFNLKRRD
jgi:hypothetical protein